MAKKPHRPAKLTPDQIPLWASNYLKDFNATRVAIEFGYAEKSARYRASEIMSDPDVQAAVKAAIEERRAEVKLEAADVLAELKRLVFFDPRKLLRDDGSPKPISELDDDTAKCIAGLDISEEWEGSGEDRVFIGYIKKYKLSNKLDAIDKAMRHLGQYNDKLDLNVGGDLAEKLQKARDRTRAK